MYSLITIFEINFFLKKYQKKSIIFKLLTIVSENLLETMLQRRIVKYISNLQYFNKFVI